MKHTVPNIGIIGFGAFGQLAAKTLAAHTPIKVWDARPPKHVPCGPITVATMEVVAASTIVILAVPVLETCKVARQISPYVKPDSIIVDVGSVKRLTAKAMLDNLPSHVDIVGTHPLFGPQSAKDGVRGRKIAICNVRGRAHLKIAALLKHTMGLRTYLTTSDEHDKELAVVQGLTHLIAGVLNQLHPLPTRLTTTSYDLMMEAIGMVRHDPSNVFDAIERQNPYVSDVRKEFINIANTLHEDLGREQ